MKKYLSLALAIVMMLAVSLTAFAAESPDKPIDDIIVSVTDKDGNDVTDLLWLEINDESRAAEAELTNDKIAELLGDDYNENIVLRDVYDVIYTGGNYPVKIKVDQDVAAEDVAFVLTKVNGEWVVLDNVLIEDGYITFSLTEDSVIAFVYEKIPEELSPPTGNNVAFVAVIALVCLAGTVYSVKRTVA